MRSNIVKYSFIFLILILIFYGTYIVYKNNKPNNEVKQSVVHQAASEEKKNFRIGISGYDNINPLISRNRDILQISKLVYEPLVKVTENYEIELVLAKEISRIDEKTYIIKINNKYKWLDNVPISANDIKFTIDRLKENEGIYSYNVQAISEVQVIDSSTVKIILSYPVSFFEYNLTFPILSDIQYQNKDMYESNEIPMGIGRFKVLSVDNNKIELVRNNQYKENVVSNIEKITIYLYNSMGEVYNSFKVGNIDFFATQNIDIEKYIGTMGYNKKEFKGRKFDFVAINQENIALNCREVRQAIQYAIDKNNILSSVFNNRAYISSSPLDFGCYLYTNDNLKSEYNPSKAKQILANNGWEYKNNKWRKNIDNRNINLEFDLVVWQDNVERLKTAEIIKEQLESIGIKVKLRKVNNDQYNSCIQNKSYDLMVSGIYNSNSPELSYFVGENNIQNYYNEEINNLLKDIENTRDKNILQQKTNRILDICKEDVPFIGLYRNKEQLIYSNNLYGDIKPNNYSYFYNINGWNIK